MLLVYFITFVLAACSMLYELIIAQTLSFLAGDTVTRYSLTIGVYLAGMGLGALFFRRIVRKGNPWHALFRVEVLLSLLGGCAVIGLSHAHAVFCYLLMAEQLVGGIVSFYLGAFLLTGGIGFITGLEIPLLIDIARLRAKNTVVTHRVLAMDYFGSLAGAVAFGLLLVPRMEMLTLSFAVALVNSLVALLVLLVAFYQRRLILRVAISVLLLIVFSFGILATHDIQQNLLKRYYYHQIYSARIAAGSLWSHFTTGDLLPSVERHYSPYQKIDMVNYPVYGDPFTAQLVPAYSAKFRHEPDFPRGRLMFLNGNFQFWSDFEDVYHEYFAHVPVILNQKVPRSVLVLGAGDGLLVRELVKYPEIEKITLVEIDRKVIELARSHPMFRALNKDALSDPRVSVVIADAYQYVRTQQGSYDAIYMDFPDPSNFDLAKLYSVEFYRLLRKQLTADGYLVLDAPGIAHFSTMDRYDQIQNMREYPLEAVLHNGGGLFEMSDDTAWITHYHTLKAAGFATIRPYVSNLEIENPAVTRVLEGMIERIARIEFRESDLGINSRKVTENRAEIARQIVQLHVRNMHTGFIMVKQGDDELSLRYRSPDIPVYVMNEQRFNLAFALPFDFPVRVDERYVNSISRPRFPAKSFWYIKTAL